MPKYRITLTEQQLEDLHELAHLGLAFRLRCVQESERPNAGFVSDHRQKQSAYDTGPRLLALLEEHIALGPLPEPA